MQLNTFSTVLIALSALSVCFKTNGLNTSYEIVNKNLGRQDTIDLFKRASIKETQTILIQPRGSVFNRIGTLLNEYETKLFEMSIKIDGETLKRLSNFEKIMVLVNQQNLSDPLYNQLLKQYSSLAGKVNVAIEEVKSYVSETLIEKENELRDKTRRSAMQNNKESKEILEQNQKRLDSAKESIDILESQNNLLEEKAENYTQQVKSLIPIISNMAEQVDNLNKNLNVTNEYIKSLFSLQEANKANINVLSAITLLNSFFIYLQDILYDLRRINDGLFSTRPLLYNFRKLNSSNTNKENKEAKKDLMTLIENNAKRENIDVNRLSLVQLLNRYLLIQYAIVVFNKTTYDVTIYFKTYFLSFHKTETPFFTIYTVDQYLKHNDTTLFKYHNVPHIIAVDENLNEVIPFTVKELLLCDTKAYITCQIYFRQIPIKDIPCIEQLFYIDKAQNLVNNCKMTVIYQLFGERIRISKNKEWDLFKGELYDMEEIGHVNQSKIKMKCKKEFHGVCVTGLIVFPPINLVEELQSLITTSPVIQNLPTHNIIDEAKSLNFFVDENDDGKIMNDYKDDLSAIDSKYSLTKKQHKNQLILKYVLISIISLISLAILIVTISLIYKKIKSIKNN